ncbi:hypothetical protein [Mesorhizobium retamae]|nr:hypothetical protein [Mesorhizobium sp. IRAMC:0171]
MQAKADFMRLYSAVMACNGVKETTKDEWRRLQAKFGGGFWSIFG